MFIEFVEDKHTKQVTLENDFLATSFLNNKSLLTVITEEKMIRGITVLGSELFLVRNKMSQISVYDSDSFLFKHCLDIPDSTNPITVVACKHNNCLYVGDVDLQRKLYFIHRYDHESSSVIKKWSLAGRSDGLSVTKKYNVLATLFTQRTIEEYTSNGNCIRIINLDINMDYPCHCFELSNDQFVVSHGCKDTLQRVCIVDNNGRIIQSYGGPTGSGVGQMHGPSHIAVDKHGHVIVADQFNDRVVLLSPTLTHLGYILIPGYKLYGTWAIHLDTLHNRLYFGDVGNGGRLFVIQCEDHALFK